MAKRDGIERCDRSERAWQRLPGGQRGIVDEHGDQPTAAAQRRLDLRADDVLLLGLQHSAPPALVGDRHPSRADHRDDHVGRLHAVLDIPVPIGARPQVAGVEEDAVAAEPGLERVGDLPGS